MKLRHAKEAEITRLTIQLQEQQARRAAMMEELSKMVKYSHYLEDVLQHEAEFGEIADIISRLVCGGRGVDCSYVFLRRHLKSEGARRGLHVSVTFIEGLRARDRSRCHAALQLS